MRYGSEHESGEIGRGQITKPEVQIYKLELFKSDMMGEQRLYFTYHIPSI